MDIPSSMMVAALLVLLLLSAFFSATETAFSSLNMIRLKSWADGDGPKAKRAGKCLALAEDYDRLLTTILIGNNLVNITATTVSAVFFTGLLGGMYGPTVSTAVLTLLVLIFGEITPKSIAKERPESFAMFVTPLMGLMTRLFTPLAFLFRKLKDALTRLFKAPDDGGITDEELAAMVEQAEDEGGLDAHESQLIRAAIEFDDLEVGEILTPRVDIEAVPEDITPEELAIRFVQTGYSRLPVYRETIDSIIGIIHEKDFYAARYRGLTDLSALYSEVIYTTPSTKISDLMRVLQSSKNHMVVVVDEYGGTEGIVTLEDILEELVGEIWDEHDEVIETFHKNGDGSYTIACSADLTDLYDLFALKGECDSATVSGWVLEQIGRIPEVGDTFDYENLHVTVTRVEHRRVLEIRVEVAEKEEAEE